MVRKLLTCETVASGQSCEQGSSGIPTAWNGYLATPGKGTEGSMFECDL